METLEQLKQAFFERGGMIRRFPTAHEKGRAGRLISCDKTMPLAMAKKIGAFSLTVKFNDTGLETTIGARKEFVNDLQVGRNYLFPVSVAAHGHDTEKTGKWSKPKRATLQLDSVPTPVAS